MESGIIELSGKAVVSDPCYGRDVWCMATGIDVKPGEYTTYIVKKSNKEFGDRVAVIMAVHRDYADSLKEKWETFDNVGVDSGQCGIFDDTIYPALEEEGGRYDDESSFYGECCKLTLGDNQGGILRSNKGVVSSSGYGDGSYELLCQYHEGERVALMVDFALEKNITVMRTLIKSQRG
jgi:hypothetical protein